MQPMPESYIHPTALVESRSIGAGTRIWAFVHVMPEAVIGNNCNIGDHGFIETGVLIGDNVTVKNHVSLWDGVTIEDDVFIGPAVAFTNDRYPRSPRMERARRRYRNKDVWLERTMVQKGCSIGANATVLGGVRLGRYSLIAAGATVTRDVEPYALVAGSPARRVGYVCQCGRPLPRVRESHTCPDCGELLVPDSLSQSSRDEPHRPGQPAKS